MKRLSILLLTFSLIFLFSFQALGADLSASVYYDLDLKNPDFAYLGGLGLSVLGSSPVNQNLRFYYGIDSGFMGLGLIVLAELGVGTEISINPGFSYEPIILIEGGINGFAPFAGGLSGLIKFNRILNNRLSLQISSGVKYRYFHQIYQFIFIPLEFGLKFKSES